MEIVLDGGVLMIMVKWEEMEGKKMMKMCCRCCYCCSGDEGGISGNKVLMEE